MQTEHTLFHPLSLGGPFFLPHAHGNAEHWALATQAHECSDDCQQRKGERKLCFVHSASVQGQYKIKMLAGFNLISSTKTYNRISLQY